MLQVWVQFTNSIPGAFLSGKLDALIEYGAAKTVAVEMLVCKVAGRGTGLEYRSQFYFCT